MRQPAEDGYLLKTGLDGQVIPDFPANAELGICE